MQQDVGFSLRLFWKSGPFKIYDLSYKKSYNLHLKTRYCSFPVNSTKLLSYFVLQLYLIHHTQLFNIGIFILSKHALSGTNGILLRLLQLWFLQRLILTDDFENAHDHVAKVNSNKITSRQYKKNCLFDKTYILKYSTS